MLSVHGVLPDTSTYLGDDDNRLHDEHHLFNNLEQGLAHLRARQRSAATVHEQRLPSLREKQSRENAFLHERYLQAQSKKDTQLNCKKSLALTNHTSSRGIADTNRTTQELELPEDRKRKLDVSEQNWYGSSSHGEKLDEGRYHGHKKPRLEQSVSVSDSSDTSCTYVDVQYRSSHPVAKSIASVTGDSSMELCPKSESINNSAASDACDSDPLNVSGSLNDYCGPISFLDDLVLSNDEIKHIFNGFSQFPDLSLTQEELEQFDYNTHSSQNAPNSHETLMSGHAQSSHTDNATSGKPSDPYQSSQFLQNGTRIGNSLDKSSHLSESPSYYEAVPMDHYMNNSSASTGTAAYTVYVNSSHQSGSTSHQQQSSVMFPQKKPGEGGTDRIGGVEVCSGGLLSIASSNGKHPASGSTVHTAVASSCSQSGIQSKPTTMCFLQADRAHELQPHQQPLFLNTASAMLPQNASASAITQNLAGRNHAVANNSAAYVHFGASSSSQNNKTNALMFASVRPQRPQFSDSQPMLQCINVPNSQAVTRPLTLVNNQQFFPFHLNDPSLGPHIRGVPIREPSASVQQLYVMQKQGQQQQYMQNVPQLNALQLVPATQANFIHQSRPFLDESMGRVKVSKGPPNVSIVGDMQPFPGRRNGDQFYSSNQNPLTTCLPNTYQDQIPQQQHQLFYPRGQNLPLPVFQQQQPNSMFVCQPALAKNNTGTLADQALAVNQIRIPNNASQQQMYFRPVFDYTSAASALRFPAIRFQSSGQTNPLSQDSFGPNNSYL